MERPDPDTPDALNRFISYVYERGNPAGLHQELWYHGFGCQAWLVVKRNTSDHEILDVRPAAGSSRVGAGSAVR